MAGKYQLLIDLSINFANPPQIVTTEQDRWNCRVGSTAVTAFPVQIIPSDWERMRGHFSSAHKPKPPLAKMSMVSPDFRFSDLGFTGNVA